MAPGEEFDTAGRTIVYDYIAVAGKSVLREVTDFLGRKISLQYDPATGDLVAILGPSVTAGGQDKVASVLSTDATSPDFMKVAVTKEADGITANFPVEPGLGGSIRPGWFTDLFTYDFLDRRTGEDRNATGSTPNRLVTTWQHDRSGNRIQRDQARGQYHRVGLRRAQSCHRRAPWR